MGTVLNLSIIALFGLIWFCIVAFLRLKQKKRFVYVFFFTIFFIYLFKVLDYTLFQFQLLLLLRYFMPDLMLNGLAPGESVNLIPLITLTFESLKTSLLNILLLLPFGFGLPFITDLRMKSVVIMGMFLSITIELLQFLSAVMADITFRVTDINDVIFNTLGAAVGYMLFVVFIRAFRRVSPGKSANPIVRYIADRPQIDTESN